jgi:hypothetical protein
MLHLDCSVPGIRVALTKIRLSGHDVDARQIDDPWRRTRALKYVGDEVSFFALPRTAMIGW